MLGGRRGDNRQNMSSTDVASAKKLRPVRTSWALWGLRGWFLRLGILNVTELQRLPRSCCCAVDMTQGQIYRFRVPSPDLWARCPPSPPPFSPNKIKPCDKCCLYLTPSFLLSNPKECTLQWHFSRKEGGCGLTWEGHHTTGNQRAHVLSLGSSFGYALLWSRSPNLLKPV